MGDIYCWLPNAKDDFLHSNILTYNFYLAKDSCRCSHHFSYNELSGNLWQQLPQILNFGKRFWGGESVSVYCNGILIIVF